MSQVNLSAILKDPEGFKKKREMKEKLSNSQREYTKVKYEVTSQRILEIERKIQKLQEEKENLERKQRNRKTFLEK